MDLVKKEGAAAKDTLTTELGDLLKPVNAAVVSGIRTVRPQEGTKEVPLQLPGSVEYDTRRVQVISARFGGRIEKLYVRYNYQPVKKGQKLFDIYSPQIVTAQEEFIFLLGSDHDNEALLRAARKKLSLLGLSAAQINHIAATRKPQYRLAVYSPYEGYLVEALPALSPLASSGSAMPAASSVSGGMDGMSGRMPSGDEATGMTASQAGTSNPPTDNSLSLTEGAYVSAGQPVFQIVNTEKVWAVFRGYPGDINQVRKGQPIEIRMENDTSQTFTGRIDLIEPFYRAGQNSATLRVYLDNPNGNLLVGNLLSGKLRVESDSGLWLPRAAVLDLGSRQVAFRREGGTLTPVEVQTGLRTQDWVKILSGLTAQDEVAANAQYLVDSEAFVHLE